MSAFEETHWAYKNLYCVGAQSINQSIIRPVHDAGLRTVSGNCNVESSEGSREMKVQWNSLKYKSAVY